MICSVIRSQNIFFIESVFMIRGGRERGTLSPFESIISILTLMTLQRVYNVIIRFSKQGVTRADVADTGDFAIKSGTQT